MGKKKTTKVVGIRKGGLEHFNLGFTKGEWFDPLKQGQVIEGVFLKSFQTDSKYKNQRENSAAYGKKSKVNYEFQRDKKVPLCIGETSGPLQAMFDSLNPGDRIHFEFKCLKREDGELCPKQIKNFKQLKNWKTGQKAWPVWGEKAWIKRARG